MNGRRWALTSGGLVRTAGGSRRPCPRVATASGLMVMTTPGSGPGWPLWRYTGAPLPLSSPRTRPGGSLGQRDDRMAPLRGGTRDHPGAVSGEDGIRQVRDAFGNRHRKEEFILTPKKRPGPALLQVEVGNNPQYTARRLGLQHTTLAAEVRWLPPGHHSRHGDLSGCQARLCPSSPSLRFADSPTLPCSSAPCLPVSLSPILRFTVSPQLPCSSAPQLKRCLWPSFFEMRFGKTLTYPAMAGYNNS